MNPTRAFKLMTSSSSVTYNSREWLLSSSNQENLLTLRTELDTWVSRTYGLMRDELRYILAPADVHGPDFLSETFRVLKEKETAKYGEYRTRRLVLEAWDKLPPA